MEAQRARVNFHCTVRWKPRIGTAPWNWTDGFRIAIEASEPRANSAILDPTMLIGRLCISHLELSRGLVNNGTDHLRLGKLPIWI